MMVLVLALMAHPAVPETKEHALQLCRPSLEQSVGAEIQSIDVGSVRAARSGLVIAGRFAALLRMGPAPAGSARTHHLGRANFNYICEVRGGRVLRASAKPLQ
jgi:hypothetical protein